MVTGQFWNKMVVTTSIYLFWTLWYPIKVPKASPTTFQKVIFVLFSNLFSNLLGSVIFFHLLLSSSIFFYLLLPLYRPDWNKQKYILQNLNKNLKVLLFQKPIQKAMKTQGHPRFVDSTMKDFTKTKKALFLYCS